MLDVCDACGGGGGVVGVGRSGQVVWVGVCRVGGVGGLRTWWLKNITQWVSSLGLCEGFVLSGVAVELKQQVSTRRMSCRPRETHPQGARQDCKGKRGHPRAGYRARVRPCTPQAHTASRDQT